MKAEPQGVATPSLLFLTPCHATPLYSHLHARRVATRFLDCSPPGWAAAVARLNCGAPAWPGRQASHGSGAALAADRQQHACESCEARPPGAGDTGQCGTRDSCRGSCVGADSIRTSGAVMQAAATRSERQLFEADPAAWLATHYPLTAPDGAALPTYVILFSNQLAAVGGWLQEGGYRLSQDLFHTHFAVDNGHEARVLVFTSSTEEKG